MKTMLLADGDLVIGQSSDYAMVTGTEKCQQDVRGAILEPLGNDRFHLGYGSTIVEHIGEPITPLLRQNILAEVNRVVGNYAAVQRDLVERQAVSDEATTYSTTELVAAVTDITVQQRYDRLLIALRIATVAGTTTVVSEVL